MVQEGKKRGRPAKYASKEEKARYDVIVKRARRFKSSTARRSDIKFIYTTECNGLYRGYGLVEPWPRND
jgi:hypothetical protein